MEQKPETVYQSRVDKYSSELKRMEIRNRNISVLRLVVFVLGFVLVYYFARNNSSSGIVSSVFIGIAAFLILIRLHAQALERQNLHKALLKVNRDELDASRGNSEQFYGGKEFNSDSHPYANDLDIFGEGSLFQYLNRTATFAGLDHLAAILTNPLTDKEQIISTQKAIDSLTTQLDWRQKFQAIGLAYREEAGNRKKVEDWSMSEPLFKGWIFRMLVVTVPLLTAGMIALLAAGSITVSVFLIYLVIPWGLSGSYAIKVNSRHNSVSRTSEMLLKYAMLLKQVEALDVSADLLRKLQAATAGKDETASGAIRSLSSILNALDNRLNFVSWALLNGLLLWDILQMVRLEAWQEKHRDEMKQWFEVVAALDVLICFANFKYNHAEAVFPEVLEGAFEINARNAGHPLIDPAVRVNNDIVIGEKEFLIITGANMAGKSTYLRTIGVNLVMAMCGAPVCASEFRFSPIRIYTSIRTRDSLKENESYFYAELKRLKAIIDALRSGQKLFIVLDEILKGTNSKDKHAGSEALLQQLLTLQASGIVATHDVLLGKLSDKFPEHIRNYCFEVDIDGNQLHFDYLLRQGVSKNMNATLLMREMGITI